MIKSYKGTWPEMDETVYLADTAVVIGDVVIGEKSSIWFGTVVRGDNQPIRIGKNTNIQDNSTLHCNRYTGLTVGDNVTVGHNVVLHSCTVGNNCLVGIGARVMDGAVIGENSIVGAGALVTPGKIFPPNSLIVGAPAAVKRQTTEEDWKRILSDAQEYLDRGQFYRKSDLEESGDEPGKRIGR